jgi:hypothetical protein
MAKTSISDVIVPSVFEKYVIERTATLSAFGASGIVESDPFFDALAAGGGNTVDMPFWQDVNPTRQILADNAPLSVNKIAASQDIARIQMDANAWSVNDLAKVLSGDDPMGALVELVGDYWIRVDQGLIVSSLKASSRRLRWRATSRPLRGKHRGPVGGDAAQWVHVRGCDREAR